MLLYASMSEDGTSWGDHGPAGLAPGRYYTVREAAGALRMSASTVWRWIAAGRLPAYRFGPKMVRISARDLEQMIRPAKEADGPTEAPERGARGIPAGPRTTPPSREEVVRRLAALARLEATAARIRASRRGEPVPSSTELVRQGRRERAERDRSR